MFYITAQIFVFALGFCARDFGDLLKAEPGSSPTGGPPLTSLQLVAAGILKGRSGLGIGDGSPLEGILRN